MAQKLTPFSSDKNHATPGDVNFLFSYAATDIVEIYSGVDEGTATGVRIQRHEILCQSTGAPSATTYASAPNMSRFTSYTPNAYIKLGTPGATDGTWTVVT